MPLLMFFFFLLSSESLLASDLPYLNFDFNEAISKELAVWGTVNCCGGLEILTGPDQKLSKSGHALRLQGRYLYPGYQGRHKSWVTDDFTKEWHLKRFDLSTGKYMAFVAPQEIDMKSKIDFRMSPSGEYGLFYSRPEVGADMIYLSHLNSGKIVTKLKGNANGLLFLADDTAVIFPHMHSTDIVLIKPTGEILEINISGRAEIHSDDYAEGRYEGRKLHIRDLKKGLHFQIDFDRIDFIKKDNGYPSIEIAKKPLQFPIYDSLYHTSDFVASPTSCDPEPEGSKNCSQFQHGEVKSTQWSGPKGPGRDHDFLSFTKFGKIKRYQKSTQEVCFKSEKTPDPQGDLFDPLPNVLQPFCITSIRDELLGTAEAVVQFPHHSLFISAPDTLKDNAEAAFNRNGTGCRGKDVSMPAVCKFEFGPIGHLGGARISRVITREMVRVNGFQELKYSENWFLITANEIEFRYIRQ